MALACVSIGFAGCASTRVASMTTEATIEGLGGTTSGGAGADAKPAAGAFTIGDRTYAIAHCRSGDHEFFKGVDLMDAALTAALRVVIDPIEGARLRVARTGATAGSAILDRKDCRELEASVELTGWEVNQFRDVRGHVDAECTLPTGEAVSAHVRFDHCH